MRGALINPMTYSLLHSPSPSSSPPHVCFLGVISPPNGKLEYGRKEEMEAHLAGAFFSASFTTQPIATKNVETSRALGVGFLVLTAVIRKPLT